MVDLKAPDIVDLESPEAEVERIIRSGTLWLAAVIVTAALLLGPAVAAGWRPADLPPHDEVAWWLGAVVAGLGVAALVWAGCPTLGYPVAEAWRQKRMCVRAGIVASLSGMTIAGLVVLLAPAV